MHITVITACTVVQADGQSNGEGRFSTTHSGKITEPILIKLQIQNYTPEATQHAKFDFSTATWVVWANSQFATVFFSFFFCFLAKATGRTVRQIWTNESSKRVVPLKEMPFKGLNDEPLNSGGKIPQKLKFWVRE